ncbi:MAG TPA: acetyl-CoA carboxylase biotin carboxyl carrier protein [Leptolyngbyaceae cyanobacterium M33_DOE_097]|uniref:Biotin carboxyl carrier protein of acetyl-CoA carboxylase n=1 Tax=Oscillatoriales cyanobacterium SpSt-418 TaxID=2282169 RepID=A0A7C3KEE9_9CYAN|nr:acetyl-CoA carboxylase biotin carboxyl carrier protein [Leptolyngbyaceae cyanobacterium M33_DOE_097]
MSLDLDEIRELIAALNKTDIAELVLKQGDFELTVRRGVVSGAAVTNPAIAAPIANFPVVAPVEVAMAEPTTPPTSAKADRRLVEITSPMVGTFYRSPAPDEPPFIDVGDRVQVGQTVCIIEAMKLMNELESEVSGEIVEVLVQNAQPVEYGQVLMRVNPA